MIHSKQQEPTFKVFLPSTLQIHVQSNFSGSNTDGSFTTAVLSTDIWGQ